MISFPKAKINIGLNVVNKRPDGYHDLETLFYTVPLCDTLEILPAPEMGWDSGSWNETPDPTTNLVWRAYSLLKEQFPQQVAPVQFVLRKGIPSGAGLGGGSSDASATLRMLREMFGLPVTDDELRSLARQLGADCPFFVNPTPHFAEGIGDLLTPFALNLSGWHLYLVLPGVHVSTKDAYSQIRPRRPEHDLRTALLDPIETWRGRVVNDFEAGVFALYPILALIKEQLYHCGASYASMSGSGSALYALSRQEWSPSQLSTISAIRIHHYLL